MTRYDPADEMRLRVDGSVRDWVRSGLLSAAQGSDLQGTLQGPLRRAGRLVRLALGAFTLLVVAAACGLVFVTIDVNSGSTAAVVCAILAAVTYAAAEMLISEFHLYRHGVEEALVVASVILIGAATALAAGNSTSYSQWSMVAALTLVITAAASGAVYHRFGYRYAALASMAAAVVIPAVFERWDESVRRGLIALACAAAFLVVRWLGRDAGEIRRDDAGVLQAAALLGIYAAINLVVTSPSRDLFTVSFRWLTFALTVVLPALVLAYGIRARATPVLRAGGVMAVVTVVTAKPYLSIPVHPWDPILLGLLLMGVAVGLRRWLASGADGTRGGFTASRILHSDLGALQLASLASAAMHLQGERPGPPADSGSFGGGRSGGGGAGADF